MPLTGATIIAEAFEEYQRSFHAITRRARTRFETRDWHGIQQDSIERLDLYRQVLTRTLGELSRALGGSVRERTGWPRLKEAYSSLVAGRDDRELAETFFNSVTRRIFTTVGVDPAIEFVDSDFEEPPAVSGAPVHDTLRRPGSPAEMVETVLRRLPLQARWASLEADARAAAERIERATAGWPEGILALDFVRSAFFRGKGAYVVGRLEGGAGRQLPLVLALLHDDAGVRVDAVLLDEDSASIVFGFTRSYFHVEVERPWELVRFLKSIMPAKRLAELYITIGCNKHGKTELYRDLLHQLRRSEERFEIARGERGMVMAVFTLPSFGVVFKVIRDRFPEPKAITREGVMEKYALVFRHDRAGRLIDAQEFEHLQFARQRFAPEVLDELLGSCAGSVGLAGDQVAIRHLYAERRLTPLNLFAREAPAEAARSAILDYGQAIRDLAATNIFPGDVLLKNFGLTRHGRVVFYDYDELARVTDCRFRRLPPPRDDEEEVSAEPWFHVDRDDIFPEEFVHFLGLPPVLHQAFLEAHGELLTAAYWQRLQERLRAGEIVDIFPYRPEQRLGR